MTKKTSKSDRAAEREKRRSSSSNSSSSMGMRSAASRRAEARARAAYRGADQPVEVGGQKVAARDVGIRLGESPAPRRKVDASGLTHEQVSRLLHNPTRDVSEATLREQYGYVLADIRSMAILAAGVFALLVVLALVLPK